MPAQVSPSLSRARLRPRRRFSLAVLCLCLLLAACAPPGLHEFETPALDTRAREQAILDRSGDDDLLDKGRELFAAGRYEAASRRFAELHRRRTADPETVIRLGLALWFAGRPGETEALWREFDPEHPPAPSDEAPDGPTLKQRLVSRASALRLLSSRLAARRILEDQRRGRLLPADPSGVVLLPEAGSQTSTRTRAALPPAPLALHALLLQALGDVPGLHPASRELLRALRAETGHPLAGSRDQALALARVLGAGYAATVRAWVPEGQPDVLRTHLTLAVAEPPAVRSARLDRQRRQAEAAWAAAESELRQLEDRRARCARVLDYFEAQQRLSTLVEQRKALGEEAMRLNRQGHATQAARAMQEHHHISRELIHTQNEIKEFERSMVLGVEGVWRFTPEAYRELEAKLNQQYQALEQRLGGLRQAAWRAVARASVNWPVQGRETSFDLPLKDLAQWPVRAAARCAALAGEPRPVTADETNAEPPGGLASRGWSRFQDLDKGYAAWDNGEYDRAAALFAQVRDLPVQPPAHPGPGFDVLRLAARSPRQVALFFLNDFGLTLEGEQ